MAELITADNARLPIPSNDALLGRHAEDGSSSDPDVDLGGLEGGKTVSRHHARIYRAGPDWYLKVQTRVSNATVVAGQTLLPEQEAKLKDGDEIRLGTVKLVFRANGEMSNADKDPNATWYRTALTPAEFRSGGQKFRLSAPDQGLLTLGRHSDDGKYEPDIDLRDIADGMTISREHGSLFLRGTDWWLRVESRARNSTFINGMALQKGQEVQLHNGDELRMGNAVVTFHQDRTPEYVESDQVDLVLGPPTEITLDPGSNQSVSLTLMNFSGRVERFDIELTGLPPEWFRIIPPDGTMPATGELPRVRLDTAPAPVRDPRATALLTLVLMPPRVPQARAGIYPLLIQATGLENRRLRRTAAGELILKPFEAIRLAIEPTQLSGSRGRLRVGLHNDGNDGTVVSIAVETAKDLEAKLDQTEVSLANGAEATLDLKLRVKGRHWWGPETVHKASVKATAGAQTQLQETYLTCPPIIPLWLQRFVGRVQADLKPILAALIILGALLLVGYLWLLPPDLKLVPDAPLVAAGDSTTLAWSARRAEGQGALEGPSGTQQIDLPNGSLTVKPDQTTEYKLTAKNLIGLPTTTSATVKVLRVLSFTATPPSGTTPGAPVVLEWKTENASAVSINPADEIPSPLTDTKVTVHPQQTTTYHLAANNNQAKSPATSDFTFTFNQSTVTKFEPDKQQVYPGDPVKLTWMAVGYTKLTLRGSPGDLELNGADRDVTLLQSITVRPVQTGVYTLMATNADGATVPADSPTITVLPLKSPRFQPIAKPISAGDAANLVWQVEGANDRTRIMLVPDAGDPIDVTGQTSYAARPDHTIQYTLQMTGADGKTVASDPLTLQVLPSIKAFSVVPASIVDGDPVQLNWTTLDADSVTITRDDGTQYNAAQPSGQTIDHPPSTVTRYTITAHNSTGDSVASDTSTAKVTVQASPSLAPLPPLPQQPQPSQQAQISR